MAKHQKYWKQKEDEGEDVSERMRMIQTSTFIFYLFSHFLLSSCVSVLVSTLLVFTILTFDNFRSHGVERII